MSKLTYQQIQKVARDKVALAADGVRWSTVVEEIANENPETPVNSIWGATQRLFKEDASIIKIARGITHSRRGRTLRFPQKMR